MQKNQEDLPKAENGDGQAPDWERTSISGASHLIKLMGHRCSSNNTQPPTSPF